MGVVSWVLTWPSTHLFWILWTLLTPFEKVSFNNVPNVLNGDRGAHGLGQNIIFGAI